MRKYVIKPASVIYRKDGEKCTPNFIEAMKFKHGITVTKDNVDYLYEKYVLNQTE